MKISRGTVRITARTRRSDTPRQAICPSTIWLRMAGKLAESSEERGIATPRARITSARAGGSSPPGKKRGLTWQAVCAGQTLDGLSMAMYFAIQSGGPMRELNKALADILEIRSQIALGTSF